MQTTETKTTGTTEGWWEFAEDVAFVLGAALMYLVLFC